MIKTYTMLTKPGIILGNAITLAGGFALASKGHFNGVLFLATLVGLSFVIASACVFNNYIDRHIDGRMVRTQNRALVIGAISIRNALIFAICLGLCGSLILAVYTNTLTALIAAAGFFIYVILYTFWKSRSTYGTVIGSIAGAVPPVVGYCAVSNSLDMAAFLIFMILVLWQIPHFFSIAMYRLEDYAAASIPVLPVKKGGHVTKVHMLFYITGFILAAIMLTVLGYTGWAYLIVTTLLGSIWLGLCLKGFKSKNDKLWGRQMFHFSLVMITSLCIMISMDIA